ncbi:MAG: DUF3494 domain-containing protein [Opitutae bacterium]|nr:DUF3494 domain-containing protein [Opitutae bacterium]
MKNFCPVALSLALTLSASAQSILQSAGNFTLLGGSAISSTATAGTVISNGNVGLSPTAESAITGFPPALITNGAIVATGGVTAQARADLIIAATGLAGMTPTSNLTGLNLGGMTLTPGVYSFTSTAFLTGALILDAQGQNNVAWVFQIGTSLATAAASSVTFTNFGSNSGSDLGVFWNAGTTIGGGVNSLIAGNYLAGTSITFGNLVHGGGRGLALSAITLDNDHINALGGPGGGDLTGGLTLGPGNSVILSSVPEPAAVLWLAPLGALGFACWRRSVRGKRVS